MPDQPFPLRMPSATTAEQGMDCVAAAVHSELGWIFRRTPQETDHGIDGYIDLVSDEGYVTGKSIAIQVKAGASYFKHCTNQGWMYKGKLRHANYYLNSPVNVVLALVDCGVKDCWWAHFDPAETVEITNGWGIEIPFKQKLDQNAKQLLIELAGDHVDYIPQLKALWKNKAAPDAVAQLGSLEALTIQVPRSEVENGDIASFALIFEFLASSAELLQECRSGVDFTISGYHNDPRELWEIPEVVSWLRKAAVEIAGLLYFLRLDTKAQGIGVLVASSGGPKRAEAPATAKPKRPGMTYLELGDIEGVMSLINFLYDGLNKFTVEKNVDEWNKPISVSLRDYIIAFLGAELGR